MEATAESAETVGRNHIIERPRLTRLLDETSARVIMLIAPAGYGKTTLARQWLANRPHAWYQAGAASSDVAALALGIAESATRICPGAGHRLREWLPTCGDPHNNVDAIIELLSSDLSEWGEDVWFVIDDYDAIQPGGAEELVHGLFVKRGRGLALTGRRRPAWSSARAVLYGEHLEVGQSSLAMTAEEADAVLTEPGKEKAAGLVALANGWPAVIGLASLTPAASHVHEVIPDALHEFLAQELFASLPPSAQEHLCRLALFPHLTRRLAITVGADDAAIEEAIGAGILTAGPAAAVVMHPLLRTFLLANLDSIAGGEGAESVGTVAKALIDQESWDDAFDVLESHERTDILEALFGSALSSLSKEGRISTLRRWVGYARTHGASGPYVDLAESEVAFRSGEYSRASVLAASAASQMAPDDHLRSAAHYRAGQSCHFLDELPNALEHFQLARAAAHTSEDKRNALWGEFTASYDSDSANLPALLEQFESAGTLDRNAQVRAACGRLTIALRSGGITEAIKLVWPTRSFVREVSDPLIRSSFWRGLGGTLAVHADYGRGHEAIACALREAEESQLPFVIPHALVTRAFLHIGERDYAAARQDLREVARAGRAMDDQYLIGNAETLRCRLLLCEGLPDEAAADTPPSLPERHALARQLEFAATKAMALAYSGKTDEARMILTRLKAVNEPADARLLLRWASVIASIVGGEAAAQEIVDAYDETVRAGAYDPFVLAYRVKPVILQTVAGDSATRAIVAEVLRRAGDTRWARDLGVIKSWPRDALALGEQQNLSPREREVFALLANARSNKDIASELFISEATVKVHVRNILRKLGVRNRTEAAVLAARANGAVASPSARSRDDSSGHAQV
jgi:ATP/maltotriose-dependent transcriptional regulator MalT